MAGFLCFRFRFLFFLLWWLCFFTSYASSVVVVESFDVVFFEVFSCLGFDDVEGGFAGVFEAVCGGFGDVGGFVFVEVELVFVFCDFGGSFDDDPVFGAVEVSLEGDVLSGVDGEAFDLVSVAFFECGVVAPGAVDGEVGVGDVAALFFEGVHDFFYILGAVFWGDEEGVGGVDDEEVVDADGGDGSVGVVNVDEAILYIFQHGGAFGGVAVEVDG